MSFSFRKQIANIKQVVRDQLNDSLREEAAKAVKQELLAQAQWAYDSYTPKTNYIRQYGMIDESKIVVDFDTFGNLSVYIEYETEDGYSIVDMVEYGSGYNWDGIVPPRTIYENTINNLRENKKHVEALKRGLSVRGIKVE